jgi:hypothetical protein
MTTLAEDAAEVRRLKQEKDSAKDVASDLERQFKAAQANLFERMEAEGVQGIKHEGTNFVPTRTVYAQLQDRRVFAEWARENAPDLIEDRERSDLLNDAVRAALDDGRELPPGVSFRVREYVSQRAA